MPCYLVKEKLVINMIRKTSKVWFKMTTNGVFFFPVQNY